MKRALTPSPITGWSRLLPVLVLLAGLLHASLFITGFRLSADDVLFHQWAMDGLSEAMARIDHTATSQGRIGHYLMLGAATLGAWLAELTWFRVLYVALYFGCFLLAAGYLGLLTRSQAGWFAVLALFALHSLDYYHLSPNAFPLAISLPVSLLLVSRIALVRLRRSADANVRREYPWLALSLLAALFYEQVFALALALVLVEWVERGKGYRDPALARDAGVLVCFLILYGGFRLLHPSQYEGNNLAGTLSPVLFFKTLAGHGLGASVFSEAARPEWGFLAFLQNLDTPSMTRLVGYFLTIALGAWLALDRALPENGNHRSASWFIAAGLALASASLAAAPLAATAKYQGWCGDLGSCAYLSSSLNYLGIGLSAACAGIGLTAWLARMSQARHATFTLVSLGLALGATLSHAHNLLMESRMRQSMMAWDRAKIVACSDVTKLEKRGLTLDRVIDPLGGISHHDRFDMAAYWRQQLPAIRARERCKEAGDAFPELFPMMEPGREITFRDRGSNGVYLLDGWSGAEPWGTWSDGDRASLLVPRPAEIESLDLDLKALVAPAHPTQVIRVLANDRELGSFTLTDRAGQRISVSLSGLGPASRTADFLVLQLLFENPASPEQLGLGSDNRQLAVGLVSLTVQ